MTKPAPDGPPVRRIDRILAFMSLGLIAISVICFFVVLLGRPLGYLTDPTEGLWPTVVVLPLIALPLGFVLMMALLIMSFTRRRRGNQA